MTPSQPKTWKVERFENGSALLKNAETTLRVSRAQLAEGTKEGDIVTAEFYPLKDEKKRKDNLARALLDEIISSE